MPTLKKFKPLSERLVPGNEYIEIYKKSFDSSLSPMFIAEYINNKPQIKRINNAFSQLFNYKEKEILGKDPKILKSGDQPLNYYRAMWKAILNIKTGYWHQEIRVKKRNGNLIDCIITINTIFDNKKKAKCFIANYIDMTEKNRMQRMIEAHTINLNNLVKKRTALLAKTNKQLMRELIERQKAEKEVKQSEEKFRLIFENTPNIIIALNKNGFVTEINNKIFSFFDYYQEEVISKNYIELPFLTSESKNVLDKNIKLASKNIDVMPFALVFKTKKGKEKIGRVTLSVYRDKRDMVIGSLIMIYDII